MSDADRITAVVRSAFGRWISVLGREPEPMQKNYERNIMQNEIYLTEAQCVVVGMMEIIFETDAIFVDVLAVDPLVNRHGYGTGLIDHADKLGRDNGKTRIRLKTVALYIDNLIFYGRRGFCVVGSEIYHGTTVLVLERKISPFDVV